jgi:hypothetical protein
MLHQHGGGSVVFVTSFGMRAELQAADPWIHEQPFNKEQRLKVRDMTMWDISSAGLTVSKNTYSILTAA